MAVRNKTRRRLWLLLLGICCLGLLGAVGYKLRQRQVDARVRRDRDAGIVALEAGDYFTALHKIGPYVQRNPRDVDAALKYAVARSNVEEPNGRHLTDAISMYRWILELKPDQPDAREKLLELYLAVRYNTEILALTQGLSDPVSIRAMAIALGNLGRTQEAEQAATRYNELKPQDLRMQMYTLLQMQGRGATSGQIVARVSRLMQAHPDDPHFQLLMGLADAMVGNASEALELTRKATHQAADDPDFIQMGVEQLDRFGRYDESLALLQQAAKVHGDITFERMVIARLFQAGHYADVVAQTEDLEKNLGKGDVELLGHRAMALGELDRADQAKRILDALASRKTELAALGWAEVLSVAPRGLGLPDEKQIIDACRDALKGRSNNPYFRLILGDSYARLGEGDAAIREWLTAQQLAPVWARPQARILRALLAGGRLDIARQRLDRLEPLASNDPESLAGVVFAKSNLSPSTDQTQLVELIKDTDRVQSLRPGEAGTLGLKVHLLSSAGRREEASNTVQTWLAPDHSPSIMTLLDLARASRNEHLGLEEACFNRSRALYGMCVQQALAQLDPMPGTQLNSDSLKQFDASRAVAIDRNALAWDISRLRLLDLLSDPSAAAQWSKLADSNPQNLTIQYAVATAKSTQSDRELQRRVIDRLGGEIGEEGVAWRLTDARLTMQSAATKPTPAEREKEYVKAVSILNDLTRRHPDLAAAQFMLGDCLMSLNKKEAAADSFAKAAQLAPQSVDLSLRLASILQSMGDFERAKPYLDQAEIALGKIAPATTAPADADASAQPATSPDATASASAIRMNLRVLATLLAAGGQTDRAANIFSKLDRDNSAIDLSLAAMLSRRGELTDLICKQLLAQATPTGIEIVAEYYAAAGRTAEAESTIAMLDKLDAPATQRELAHGMYLANRGSTKEAIEHLQAACSADRSNRGAWQSLIAMLMRDGQGEEALKAATNARQALPTEVYFTRILDHADLLRSLSGSNANPARTLLAFLPTAGDQADAILAACEVIRGGLDNKKTVMQVAAELRPIADEAKSFWPLQRLMIDMYARSGNLDNATALATRSMELAPADPAPAQRMVELLVTAGRWEQVIRVAQDWRLRLGPQARAADDMLVTAYFATGNATAAMKQLQPYRQSSAQDPAATLNVDAQALLSPSLKVSSLLRAVWMDIAVAVLPDPKAARQWMQQIEVVIPADAIDERITLCSRWFILHQRTSDPADLQTANDALRNVNSLISSAPQATSKQWLELGSLKELAQDEAGAESAYRACLKLDLNDAVAQNNLAMILVQRNGDLNEAAELASRAAADPAHPAHAEFLDTYALVQSKAGKHEPAEAAIKKALALQPQNLSTRTDLVQVLLLAGKTAESRQALTELEQRVGILPRVDPQLTARIEKLRSELLNVPDAR